jgi:hypothetical protein
MEDEGLGTACMAGDAVPDRERFSLRLADRTTGTSGRYRAGVFPSLTNPIG